MTDREWVTMAVVITFLVLIVSLAFVAQDTRAATITGPETTVSLADLCPPGAN